MKAFGIAGENRPILPDCNGANIALGAGEDAPTEPGRRDRDRCTSGFAPQLRLPPLPDTPTIAETVPGYECSGWNSLLVPAGSPPDVIAKLHAAVIKAAGTPEFRDYLFKEGSEYVGSTPEQFAVFLRNEVKKNGDLVRAAGIKPQ